jgi:hypothetical protein
VVTTNEYKVINIENTCYDMVAHSFGIDNGDIISYIKSMLRINLCILEYQA